ncbi:MAG: serine/threonine protein kinase [Sulfuriflexus sp.]|nr:serine/threonine protein kinase [Sulfuriflexus sp.]
MKNPDEITDFYDLGPSMILDAVETLGFKADGSLLALNSYENRVYRIGIEDDAPLVVKFYRPQRWTDAMIQEEHDFALELADVDIPVVAPLLDEEGKSLHFHAGHRFAVFPCQGGRTPELNGGDDYVTIGRFIGRIHNVGRLRPFTARPTVNIDSYARESYQYVLENGFIPAELELPYRSLVEDILPILDSSYQQAGAIENIRLHGDCHASNILWTDTGPHFVDLDDCRTGPAVQDLWMLLNGSRQDMTMQIADLLDGYTEFSDFEPRELHLVETLRTMRLLYYSAWLARRWEDPAFPRSFPWFNTNRYWEDQILSLREQFAALQEPALVWN